MNDDINTKRTELANEMASAGAALLDFTGTAAALAAIPDTEPQQYVAAGTPENIAAILPATICPQRRMRHGERPSAADLEWGEEPTPAATSGDAPIAERGVMTIRVEHNPADPTGFVRGTVLGCPGSPARLLVVGEDSKHLHTFTEEGGYYGIFKAPANLGCLIVRQRAAVSAATKPTADLSATVEAVRKDIIEMIRAHGAKSCADYISDWYTADKIIANLGQSLLATKPAVVPTDYVLVPRELTPEMAIAVWGRDGIQQAPGATYVDEEVQRLYRAMLAAAPAAPTAAPADQGEGKSLNAKVADLLRPYLKEGQKVIWREPFRWHDDNGVMSNHYDGFSIKGLAEEFNYQVPYDFNFNHAAIVGTRTSDVGATQTTEGAGNA